MNRAHLELCSSAEWASMIETQALPWVTEGLDLGGRMLEVGPGPGAATGPLSRIAHQLVAVELDADLASGLARRFRDSGVSIVRGDATRLPLAGGAFDAAASLTMLHHVPGVELQDLLLAEVARVLRPGGVFVGSDSLDSPGFRDLHVDDVCVPLDPATLEQRLLRAGFASAEVATQVFDESGSGAIRFRARTGA